MRVDKAGYYGSPGKSLNIRPMMRVLNIVFLGADVSYSTPIDRDDEVSLRSGLRQDYIRCEHISIRNQGIEVQGTDHLLFQSLRRNLDVTV
jgi:hypothetical protein